MDYHAAKQLDNKQQQLAVVVEAGRAAELRSQVLVSDAEWGQRWRVLSSVRLTRSFLWKLTHRRTPNLAQHWLEEPHYQRAPPKNRIPLLKTDGIKDSNNTI